MSEVFDPYYEWLGIPPKDQPPNHYRLLGIELFEQNANVIERAADRQMGHVRSYQTGRHSRESQKLLNELSSAKVCLLNSQRKSEYDDQLRLKISTSLPELGLFGDSQVPGFPPPVSDVLPPDLGPPGLPGAIDPQPAARPPGLDSWPGTGAPVIPEVVRVHVTPAVQTPAVQAQPAVVTPGKSPPGKSAVSKSPDPAIDGSPRPLMGTWYAGSATSDTHEPRPRAAWLQLAVGGVLGLLLLAVAVGGWWWSSGDHPAEPSGTVSQGQASVPATSGSPTTPPTTPATPPVAPPPTVPPSPAPNPSAPVEQRISSWLRIAEKEQKIRWPKALNRPPNIPEGLRAQLQGAGGGIENTFAYCQTLLGDRFEELHTELRGMGYRLSRFRPYVGLGECRVAAIWYRDFLPTICLGLTDAATLREADAEYQEAGFVPIDVQGLTFEGIEYFSAAWAKPASGSLTTSMTLGLSDEEYVAETRRRKESGLRSAVHGVHFVGESRRYCDVWVPAADGRDVVCWAGGAETAAQHLAQAQLTVDACIVVPPNAGAPVIFGLQWPTNAAASQAWTGLTPDAAQAAAQNLSASGLVPISLSVVSLPHGELQSVATWRAPGEPATVLELVQGSAGTASPSTPPPTSPMTTTPSVPPAGPESAPERAIQLTSTSSIELRDTIGQARISSEFTIEAWIRLLPPAFGTANLLFGTSAYKGTHPDVTDVEMKGWLMGLKPATPESGGKSQFIMYWMNEGKTSVTHSGEFPAWTPGWHHLAVCNRGATDRWQMELFLDGKSVLEASDSMPRDLPGPVPLYLGRPRWVPDKRRSLPCLIRGFRLSQGIRYPGPFKPESQWKEDGQTLALFDFGSEPSATTIRDLTANHRDGQLAQVAWTDAEGNPIVLAGPPSTPPPPKTTGDRLPVPAKVEEGIAKIRSVFQAEMAAAKDPAQHLALADKLLTQAENEADPQLQFALFAEARRLAIEAGDWPVTARSIDLQVARFDSNPWLLRGEAFVALNKRVKGTSDRKSLGATALDLAESALNDEVFDSVETLLASASSLAPRGEKEMVKHIADVRRRLADEKKAQQAVRDAKEKLQSTPDDPAAHEVLGRYYCFVRDDWELGLPHLAQGSTAKLVALAKSEASPPSTADERAELANSWTEVAKGTTETGVKGGAAGRALYWYRLAVADVTGVKKLQWDKSIEDLEKMAPSRAAKSRFAWHDGAPGLALELQGHTSRVTCVAIARSGRFLVSGGQDDSIRIWDLATGKQSGQLDTGVRNQGIHSLLLGPDDHTVAVPQQSQRDFRIGLWNLQTGQAIGSVETAWLGNFLVGSTDWKRVVHGSQQGSRGNLLAYDLTTLKPVAPLTCPGPPLAIAISRSGRYFAAADGSNTVYVWDLQSGKPPTPLTGQGEAIFSLAFAPNERQIVSGGNRTLVLWDVLKGVEDRRISVKDPTISVAYSPDGARLLVSPNTATLQVLSARDGSLIGEWMAPNQPTNIGTRAIYCFPDGRAAATIGDDVTIRVWRLP